MASLQLEAEPHNLLHSHGIPCFAWFEDAIACYDVPTIVFDLYLLVLDIDRAVEVLCELGWTKIVQPPSQARHFLHESAVFRSERLNPPSSIEPYRCGKNNDLPPPPPKSAPGSRTTTLLCATEWNVDPARLYESLPNGSTPSLPVLVDALIDSLLDSPNDTALQGYLAMQLSYLYGHSQALKARDFVMQLKPEHRKFHSDALLKGGIGTLPFISQQREFRNNARDLENADRP